MAQSPQWKVYRGKEYVAACKYAEDAAAIVMLTGSGTIKHGHGLTVWTEGQEAFSAGESYDGAAQIMHERLRAAHIASLKRNGWTDERIAEVLDRLPA